MAKWVYDEKGNIWNFTSDIVSQPSLQLTCEALKWNEAKWAMCHLHYRNHYTPEQTVFVDESSFDRRTGICGICAHVYENMDLGNFQWNFMNLFA